MLDTTVIMSTPLDLDPELSLEHQARGDEEGLVIGIVKCSFASQETRFVYVMFETNHRVPDAVENKVTLWDVDHHNDADMAAYHHAVHDLAVAHIFPLISAIPPDTLLRSPEGIAAFTLATINGSVKLLPGLTNSMKAVEDRWLQRCPPVDSIPDLAPAVVYDIDDIVVVDLLDGGSRDAMLAVLRDQPATRYVAFWIPTFTVFAWSDEDDHGKGILHEMAFLRTIPPHPHIISPPVRYISRIHNGKKVICGFLLKYYPGGSLGAPERVGAPIAMRIKWAYQIASGLHHLHHVAHTYHGDIKLDNVVLDENGDAVLIDFEQGRANEGNAAPELHAASLVSVNDDGILCYSTPSPRKDGTGTNAEEGEEYEDETVPRLGARQRPYDIWKDTLRAIEAAETWSFATALQPLLLDAPDAVSAILARCRTEDPNCRPTFEELERFFLDLYQSLVQER